MKRVLFIGTSFYNFREPEKVQHLKEKFEGLNSSVKTYVLAKGRPFRINRWGTEFYLLKPGVFAWVKIFFLGLWLCLSRKIDVIVAQSPLMEGFVGASVAKIFRKELIVEMHGDWIEGPFLSKKRKLEKLERKLVPLLANFSLKRADKIRAVAEYLIKQAREAALSKKWVLSQPRFIFPTFTDLSPFLEEHNVRFEKFILFVGQLAEVKGVKYLIEAFSEIAGYFPDFRLVIIGEGEEKKELQSQAAALRIENRVNFKGKVPLEEVKENMRRCYCLVLPSLSEGLPRVLMEAMALSKPVVAGRVGGIPEIVKDKENGFLTKARNSSGLAKKLKILLQNQGLAEQMGKKGRGLVMRRFSNEQYIKNYLQMINL